MQDGDATNWDDLKLFALIAAQGSFRAAANQSGMVHSTLARRIDQLEHRLGTRLLMRTRKGLALTQAGETVLAHTQQIHQSIHTMQASLSAMHSEVSGRLRLTVPGFLLRTVLFEPLSRFTTRQPALALEIDTSHALLDLHRSQTDIAIRITHAPPDTLIAKQIGTYAEAVYVRPDLRRNQTRLAWISPGEGYTIEPEWIGRSHRLEASLTVADLDAQCAFAVAGVGAATLPVHLGDATPALQRISAPVVRAPIWLLSHPEARRIASVQKLKDLIVEVFSQTDGKATA